MLDAQNTPALPAVTRREAYQPPDWHIPELALDFDLDPAETRVRATLSVMRAGAHDRPLRLDGAGQVPLPVTVDGEIGRASCRERVCRDVLFSGVDVSFKNKKKR